MVHWTMWDKYDRVCHKKTDYETFIYKDYKKNII